jgi:hypothetical protein
MLGFDISERTVSRWVNVARRNPDPARRWLAFLRKHREALAVPWILSCSEDHARFQVLANNNQKWCSERRSSGCA